MVKASFAALQEAPETVRGSRRDFHTVALFSSQMFAVPPDPPRQISLNEQPKIVSSFEGQFAAAKIGDNSLLICGDLRGGDILAAEVARSRGAQVRFLIPSSTTPFESPEWESRFRKLSTPIETANHVDRIGPVPSEEKPESRHLRWCVDSALAESVSGSWILALLPDLPEQFQQAQAGWTKRGGRTATISTVSKTPTANFRDRLSETRPRKLLAIDGGGARSILSLEILARIESLLSEALGREDFVLSDHFDYIGGTSTGAILAACLSLGMKVAQIKDLFFELSRAMFSKAGILDRFRNLYRDTDLMLALKNVFGETTRIGSDKLRTLLMIVLKNATTSTTWPVTNNPHAKYNDPSRADSNLNLPLWQLLRASTAAPAYFPPERIRIGSMEFICEDGGVGSYNNPAFLLFQMATVKPYRLGWPTGEKQLLLVSIGAGVAPPDPLSADSNLLSNAARLPSVLLYDAEIQQDRLCRLYGNCRAGDPIDRELGNLSGADASGLPKLFTYLRYQVQLTADELFSLGVQDVDLKSILPMDSPDLATLQRVGKRVAEERVRLEHFLGFLS
jgi:hypothetical protein